MSVSVALAPLRAHGGQRRTTGLDDATVDRMAATHPELREAIDAAAAEHALIAAEFADLLELDESAQIEAVQAGYVNFYSIDAVNPYVALTARGPWVVTLKGAVVHDSGGYGMLFGPRSTKKGRKLFAEKIKANPRNYMAQPLVSLSTAPVLVDGDAEPRHVDLRPFILQGRDVYVTPGGLTRVALVKGSFVVNSSQGGGSKDTWIVREGGN